MERCFNARKKNVTCVTTESHIVRCLRGNGSGFARILFTLRPLAVRVLAVQTTDSIAGYSDDSIQNERSVMSSALVCESAVTPQTVQTPSSRPAPM
jgi:hypothetical protein